MDNIRPWDLYAAAALQAALQAGCLATRGQARTTCPTSRPRRAPPTLVTSCRTRRMDRADPTTGRTEPHEMKPSHIEIEFSPLASVNTEL